MQQKEKDQFYLDTGLQPETISKFLQQQAEQDAKQQLSEMSTKVKNLDLVGLGQQLEAKVEPLISAKDNDSD